MNNKEVADEQYAQMFKEFMIGVELSHPYIVRYMYFVQKKDTKTGIQNSQIFMEYLSGGSLDEFIRQHKGNKIKPDKIKLFMSQIVSAIKYLHYNEVVHQDLKSENVLLCSNYERVKIIDLGISKKINYTLETLSAQEGTINWRAPE